MARPTSGYHINGKPVPGVTTICSLLAKPALIGWAGRTCTEVAWAAGKEGKPQPKWTDILYPRRDRAADAGTLAHELLEAYLKGNKLPTIPEGEVGQKALKAFENARNWIDITSMKIIPYEKPVVSHVWLYGGTPDAVAVDKHGNMHLMDWKTSGIYSSAIIQLAAYRTLLSEVEHWKISGAHIVSISRDNGDVTHCYFDTDIIDYGWEVFVRLLEVYPLVSAIEARIK